MSVRKERVEETPTNNCPSRGLGVAAAAIGVGVGAALYYFFSKRSENPDGQGSTSGWSEHPQTLNESYEQWETTSEHSTTDTSVNDSRCYCGCSSSSSSSDTLNSSASSTDSFPELTFTSDSYDENTETGYNTRRSDSVSNTSINSISETEWDMTDSSLNIPSHERQSVSPLNMLYDRISSMVNIKNKPVDSGAQKRREQAFRERSWTLEECSICFEIMLKDQNLVQLPCSHNFHETCLGPWLEEHQTCPMCRKPLQ